MAAIWIDINQVPHELRINGAIARDLKTRAGLDLMKCLAQLNHVDEILRTVSEDLGTLMVACAVIERIPVDKLDAYFELWDGNSFETAGIAFMEAMTDFFPERPRALLGKVISKSVAMQNMLQAKAMAAADTFLNSPDFALALEKSMTHGNGGDGFAGLSE